MKKLIISLVALFLCVPVFAELSEGQHILGGRLGLGFQLENSGISYPTDNRVDWGTLGAEVSLFYYYMITDHIGLGADIAYGDFDGGDFFVSTDKVDDKTKLLNTMLSAKFVANPSNPVRLYMPVGLGMAITQQDMHIHKGGVDFDKKKIDTSLAWFIGAGFEFDISNTGWSMGFETRYNSFRYETEKLVHNAPSGITGHGNRHMSYMSLHMQVNKRF